MDEKRKKKNEFEYFGQFVFGFGILESNQIPFLIPFHV